MPGLINSLVGLVKSFLNLFSDLPSLYTFQNCSALKSQGIYVNGQYLIKGSSNPQFCRVWGKFCATLKKEQSNQNTAITSWGPILSFGSLHMLPLNNDHLSL